RSSQVRLQYLRPRSHHPSMTAKGAGFLWDPRVAAHVYRDDHPLKPKRLIGVHDTLERLGAFARDDTRVLTPRAATRAEIERIYDSDQVLTVSLHQYGIMPDVRRPFFPGTGTADERGRGKGAGYSVNVALPAYTDGAAYVRAFDAVVPPLLERYRPDVLVTQQGIDSHFDDPLTHLMVSTQAREHVVRRLAATAVPWVAMGGGGYSLDAVRRAWSMEFLI